MDLLRSLGTAAASSILQKSGLTFPFALGERIDFFEGKTIWTLHDAIKRDDSSPVSVFVFDSNIGNRRSYLPIAKNALKKLRTTRHPDVLKFIDVVETETTVYIVTERIQPLGKVLNAWQNKPAKDREEWLVWGLHRIVTALTFLNDPCQSTHGNVRIDSIFISPSGEWKLGGFDVLSSPNDESAVLYNLGGLVPDSGAIATPEVKSGGWSALKSNEPAAADAYALGLLLHSVFNLGHPPPPTIFPPHPPPPPSSRGSIPPAIFSSYRRLLNPGPKTRFTAKSFLELGLGQVAGDGAGFFTNNGLFKICAGLDGFPLASESEKNVLLRTLRESAAAFPPEFSNFKVLPSLLQSLEHGGASAAQVLPLALQLGKNLSPADYTTVILGPIVRLYGSADRGTRMALLDNLTEYADKLDKSTVSDKIWPNLQSGFGDTVAIIREATIRSILLIAPKLSDRVLNNDLLRHLAKTQMDPEASIRTNTCILLGKIASSLGPNTRRKVLVPAFTRSLKDTFVHARVAGLMALMATIDSFDVEDLATKVIPAMSFCLIDKEKLVREQAFKALEIFTKKLEAYAATLSETALAPDLGIAYPGPSAPGATTLLSSTAAGAAVAAGSLAGWAMSGLSKKLAASDLQTPIGEAQNRPSSAPPANGQNGTSFGSVAGPSLHVTPPTSSSTFSPTPKPKGMQLGHKSASMSLADELAAETTPTEVPGAWDDSGDLMDVAADQGDWSEFSKAPGAPQLEASYDPDAWGDMLDPSETKPASPPPMDMPNLSIFAPATRKTSPAVPTTKPRQPTTPQPSLSPPAKQVRRSSLPPSSNSATPKQPSPAEKVVKAEANEWDDSGWKEDDSTSNAASPSATPLSALSKEEKAAEMARRKEERKNRIAQLKEAKKAGKA